MKRVKYLLFLLPAIIVLACPLSVLGATETLNPTADSFVNDFVNYSDNNYGAAHSLITSITPVIRLIFIKFDLSSLPSGATIDNATLQLYLYSTQQAVDTILICRRVTANWSEMGITWNNQPGEDTTSQANSNITISTGWKEWNVTDIVRNWQSGSWSNYGFKILSTGGAKSHSFRSREYSSNHPELAIDYTLAPTPTPTSIPTPTATPTPKATPTIGATPEPEEPIPTPEEVTPTPTPVEQGKILGIISPGQALGGGLILLGLVGLGIGSFLYLRNKKKKKEKIPTPSSEKKEKESSEKS